MNDDEIYQEGYDAFFNDEKLESNPYSGMDAEFWSDGFEDAEEDYAIDQRKANRTNHEQG